MTAAMADDTPRHFPSLAARRARLRAQRDAEQAEAKIPAAEALGEQVREALVANHFAELIEHTLAGRVGS